MTGDEGHGAGRGGNVAVGCGLAAAALLVLCVVPVGAFTLLGRAGLSGGSGVGPPIAPIGDPSHAGLGVGGPHMPTAAFDVHPVPTPDEKVLDLRVVSIDGATWTEIGASCRVRLFYDPAALAAPCSARVTCGEMPVYGDGEAVGSHECSADRPPDGLRAGADRSPMSEDGTPLFVVEDDLVRVSDPGYPGRPRGFELVLSRTAPPDAPAIDPASIVDPAAVQAVPPTWPATTAP